MFTCHLSKLSGMCLHLAWTNISKFPAGPEQYFSLLLAANEEACLQVIRHGGGGVGEVLGFFLFLVILLVS